MYQHTISADTIRRTTDNKFIGVDEGNADYRACLAWVAEGNTIAAYAPPAAPVPTVISMRQARLALLAAGLLPSVDAAIAAMPSPQKEAAAIEWEYATEVRRDNALLGAMAAGLSLDSDDLDGLFTTAAAL